MDSRRRIGAFALACMMLIGAPAASAQRRAAPRQPARRATKATPKPTTTRRAPAQPAANAADARMTGVFRIDARASADPVEIARRATASLPPDEQQRLMDDLTARLNAPPQIAIQRKGRTFDIASTRAPRITFDADGQTHTEPAADGHTVRTRAVVYGDSLMISSRGSLDDEFSVNFDAVEGGRRLRVTRRIYEQGLTQPVVVQSLYDRVSPVARFSIYGEPVPVAVAETARDARQPPPRTTNAPAPRTTQPQQQPPVIRRQEPPPPADTGFYIGDNARFVGTLDRDLTTETAREGDPFTLTVREPASFAGAQIEGRVARVERGGALSGRAGMTLEFQRIVLRDGRTADFGGYIEDVRPTDGEDVRVDNESRGNVEGGSSQTDRTAQRAAIGAAIGAIIGAIANGGKGAAIGAAVGAGAGLGSVYVQGRDDLELRRGTEITLRTTRR
jgi:hypothetical protein